jgi:hypothetical protein
MQTLSTKTNVDQLAKYKKDGIDLENVHTKVIVQSLPPRSTNEKA